ncbi:MAG: succinate--CoA ligase subunit alpha [Armatimonadota bacterium]
MAILCGKDTKVLVQGMTGEQGSFHAQLMMEYGTQVVAGVTPGKAGQECLGVPVFDTVQEAAAATGANASAIFVPERFAADAVCEAAAAGLELVVCITEGIPVQDVIRALAFASRDGCRVIGPNCPGIITPGECKIGIIPGHIVTPGDVGIVSRSGTLTYEIMDMLTRAGLGQSTCIGIGGDPVLGMRFVDILPLFEQDPGTSAVVLVGEIGGSDEEIAAEYIAEMSKPVIGFVSGRTAPPGKRMGHAGAIISGGTGTPQAKVEALEKVGVPVADSPHEIPGLVAEALGRETLPPAPEEA